MRRLAIALLSLLPTLAFAADPPPLTVPVELANAIARCLHAGCTRDVDDQIYFKLVDLAQEADAATKAKTDAKPTAAPADAPKP